MLFSSDAEYAREIGRQLWSLRVQYSKPAIPIYQAANAAGVDKGTYSKWEKGDGESTLNLVQAKRLKDAFGWKLEI